MKNTVIYHSADFDGLFCREIARKFLPADTEFIGWNFGDEPIGPLSVNSIYVLDLPVDRVFGFDFQQGVSLPEWLHKHVIWIDHHKSSIETHPASIPGYCIDGVAACRLAWQWFTHDVARNVMSDPAYLPTKDDYVQRSVSEPLAVRLAGEYDIWDKRDDRAELFQHGLRSRDLQDWWVHLLDLDPTAPAVEVLLEAGKSLQFARMRENESIIKELGFTFQWEGLTWLACNAARYNSLLFTAGLKPEHDACFGFKWTGKAWSVSLYHAPGHEQHDLSAIAKKFGGGGHRGACGFLTATLPCLPVPSAGAEPWKSLVQRFVGASAPDELRGMAEILKQSPVPEEDKKLALESIAALLADAESDLVVGVGLSNA